MKVFITSLKPLVFKKISSKSNSFKGVPLLFLFFSMPIYAETHYLFPSDISNQTEPATERMSTAGGLYRQRYPHLLYASDFEPRNRSISQNHKLRMPSFQMQNGQRQTNILYASDIELNKHSIRQKNKGALYSFQKRQEQLRSVPAPLFPFNKWNAPKMQSKTIPGFIVPSDYSYLDSDYINVGLNGIFTHQYNDLISLEIYPEQWD